MRSKVLFVESCGLKGLRLKVFVDCRELFLFLARDYGGTSRF
jgi:hypothetical protein